VKPEIVDLTLSPVQQKTTRIQVDFKPETGEPTLFQPSEPSEPRSLTETIDAVRVGSFFASFEKGKDAVCSQQALSGHVWRTGQTKRGSDGSVRRITLRCSHYGQPKATHLMDVDPSDHRCGFTKRTDCSAHVNLVALPGGGWHANVVDFTHNHPPEVPLGGHIQRPPTDQQRQLVVEYAGATTFTRAHMAQILSSRYPDRILEPKQISNLINAARREAREEVRTLGGDIPSVLAKLRELKELDPRWDWDVLLDEKQVVIGLWWQSPIQADLSRRYSDILINDNTYCRNQYGYPLNIGSFFNHVFKPYSIDYMLH
jgi:hypothetical protein